MTRSISVFHWAGKGLVGDLQWAERCGPCIGRTVARIGWWWVLCANEEVAVRHQGWKKGEFSDLLTDG